MNQQQSESKTLGQVRKEVSVAEIVRHGSQVTIPASMTLEQAVDLLLRRMEFEEQTTVLKETFPVFPYDGAAALDAVLTKLFGWSPAIPIPGFFSDKPPQLVSVEVGPGMKKQVPFGRFQLYGADKGWVQCGAAMENGQLCFEVTASIKRKDESMVQAIFAAMTEYLKTGSIYRGKALRIRFRNEDGTKKELPTIGFVDVSGIKEAHLVYSAGLMKSIETNLFTPIRRVREMLSNGLPIKRTVLLGGIFGTGKTLAAAVASKIAVEQGVTHLYVPRADELHDALQFARQYSDPACVVFCEDIDRVMRGERSIKMDDLLNIIDGVDTKTGRIITVLTSNEADKIHAAMLRNGRLDAVIEITPPDGPAVERLIRLYGDEAIDPKQSLARIGKVLEGHIPATIAEVVKRAKLSQLKLNRVGELVEGISEEALLDAAESMKYQLDLLAVNSKKVGIEKPTIDGLIEEKVGSALANGGGTALVNKVVDSLEKNFGFERQTTKS